MLKEFAKFLKEFNIVSLAVGFVMGTASSALVNSNSPQSVLFDGASQLTVMAPSLIVGSKGFLVGLAQSGSSALCVVTVFS